MSARPFPSFCQLAGLALALAASSPASAQARSRDEQPAPPQTRTPVVERSQPTPDRTMDRPMVDRPTGRTGGAEAPRPTPRTEARGDRAPGRIDPSEAPRPTPRAGAKSTPPPQVVVPAIPPDNATIVLPRALSRWTEYPNREHWKRRDLFAEIQAMARRGFIPVEPLDEDVETFTGISEPLAGWKAYGFRVPGGEKLHVRLRHSNEGWFRLLMVNKWGLVERGMLQNLIPTGNPEVSYTNFTEKPHTVYVIVDDPGFWASLDNPFNIKIDRSWDPAKKKVERIPFTTGIWAQQIKAPSAATSAPAGAAD